MDELIRKAEELFPVEWLHVEWDHLAELWSVEIGGCGRDGDPVTYSFEAKSRSIEMAKLDILDEIKNYKEE